MKPSVGRIVHYNYDGPIFAAIITRVNADDSVALQVFRIDGTGEQKISDVTSARFDDTTGAPAEGKWAWPPRVP